MGHVIEIDVEVSEVDLKLGEKPSTPAMVATELMYLINEYMTQAYPNVNYEIITHDNFKDPIN